jgi:hypothetical protein
MPIHELTQLQYSTEREGPFRLYIYTYNGEGYSTRAWFNKPMKMKYPDEEIPFPRAEGLTKIAVSQGREVRVCDGGDMLVYHAKDGKVLYGEGFWQEIAA